MACSHVPMLSEVVSVEVRVVGTCIFHAAAASVDARPCGALQQVWNRTADTRVGHEAHHALGPCLYVDAVRLRENGVADGDVELPGAGAAADNEQPGLAFRLEAERRARRQFDPFEHEVRVGYQKRPFVREPLRFQAYDRPAPRLPQRWRLQREDRACGRNRTCGTLHRCAAGSPQSRDLRRSRGSYRREQKQHRPAAPSATRQDPRSSRRRQPRAIAGKRAASSDRGRSWLRVQHSGCTRLRSCHMPAPSTARTHRPDEPEWKVAGS